MADEPMNERPRLFAGQHPVDITITIDPDTLARVTDETLALYWHVAQANPAPYGDYRACNLVARIGWEIARRFLRQTEPSLYHHQPSHYPQKALGELAEYNPPDGVKVSDPRWHYGTWTARPREEGDPGAS